MLLALVHTHKRVDFANSLISRFYRAKGQLTYLGLYY
jgi:hypothetical protein